MSDPFHLQRFLDAQADTFDTALAELRAGSKQGHWMWFIFPQLAALGRSPIAKYYGIASLDEARAYFGHPILGDRLHLSVEAMLPFASCLSAQEILGSVDAMKLRSSLTLFDTVAPASIFERALDAFCNGDRDSQTLALLNLRV